MTYQIDRADYCSEAGAQRNAALLAVTGWVRTDRHGLNVYKMPCPGSRPRKLGGAP